MNVGALKDVEKGSVELPCRSCLEGDRGAITAGPVRTTPIPVNAPASTLPNLLVPVTFVPRITPSSDVLEPVFLASPSTRRRVVVDAVLCAAALPRDVNELDVRERGSPTDDVVDVEVDATADKSSEGLARGRPDLLLGMPAAGVFEVEGREDTRVLRLMERVMVLGAASVDEGKVALNGGSALG